jgi:hypothetical protein
MLSIRSAVLVGALMALGCTQGNAPHLPHFAEGAVFADVVAALGEPQAELLPPFIDYDATCETEARRALLFTVRASDKSNWTSLCS